MLIEDSVMLQLHLDRTQKEVFQVLCNLNDVTMSQQVRKLIRAYLSEQGIDPPYKTPQNAFKL